MRIYKIKASFIVTDSCVLPKYKTQLFRGIFGNTFRELLCKNLKEGNCPKCSLKHNCEIAKNFHNLVLNSDNLPSRYKGYSNLSPQYVFYNSEQKIRFEPNDSLTLEITFFEYPKIELKLLVLILLKMGDNSIIDYKSKASLQLVSVSDVVSDSEIYIKGNFYDMALKEVVLAVSFGRRLTKRLVFKTPCRIIKKGVRISNQLNEEILQEIIYERLFILSLGSTEGYTQLWSSEDIEILDKNLFWTEVSHKSNRQRRDLKLGGFIGDMIISSKNEYFWKDLFVLEQIHIGTNTQSGYGKFVVSDE